MAKDWYGICPYITAQKVVHGKWTILIMHYLSKGPLRFNQLLRMLPAMTHAALSKQLRQLEQFGLIIRTEYPQVPPKVEYELSDIGRELMPTLCQLRQFGAKYIEHINSKQAD